MPDVARLQHPEPQGALDWVGMDSISTKIRLTDSETEHEVAAAVQVYVDLHDPHTKGIHMSRLYRSVFRAATTRALAPKILAELLAELQQTHNETSNNAFVEFTFDLLLNRPALISENQGFNRYPVHLRGRLVDGDLRIEQEFVLHYSSTCPASAALSRSLIQDQFVYDFSDQDAVSTREIQAWLGSPQGVVATPHGQRSAATIKTQLRSNLEAFPLTAMIDLVENALETPVQTAVKREDEREFALRNGQNPMFCEDAARIIKQAMLDRSEIEDFLIKVQHFESLHAHNAVSMVAKGVPNGFRAIP